MKNALLRYDALDGINKNIGDYIQSVAAMQFVGSDAILIEREHLHVYDGEDVKLIMNAWWMHYPENFPPTNKIKPLFISFHINPGKAKAFLTEKTVNYLKSHEPIGCRDQGTKRLLEQHGVSAYFTGCLTLTLGETYKHKLDANDIYIVEPYQPISQRGVVRFKIVYEVCKFLISNLKLFNKLVKLTRVKYKNVSLKFFIKTVDFYRIYSQYFADEILTSANYITHNVYEPAFDSEVDKFNYTDELLKKYANAKLVITSRLHAALPCLSMETPVVFVNNKFFQNTQNKLSPGRFEGLIEHLNVFDCSNDKLIPNFPIAGGRISLDNIPQNRSSFKVLSKKLIDQCKEFIGNR